MSKAIMLPVFLAISVVLAAGSDAGSFPQAVISNGSVNATVYLPDAQRGYYRATRFDWSGVIASLEWNGHNYFGRWFDKYDPKTHDAIMGPVEEFLTGGEGLGYGEARPGGTFLKIGIGVLRRPEEPRFRQFETYDIVNPGLWKVSASSDSVVFAQTVRDPASGYAYAYRKALRLTPGKPELILEHELRNTGSKVIETDVYEHDFYMLDGRTSGPDLVIRFPFDVSAAADLGGKAATHGHDLVYLRELAARESVYSELRGYGSDTSDNDIRVENTKTGAGVRETGSLPLSKLVFWSIGTTACPEAYVHLRIEPQKEARWSIRYEFYETVTSGR